MSSHTKETEFTKSAIRGKRQWVTTNTSSENAWYVRFPFLFLIYSCFLGELSYFKMLIGLSEFFVLGKQGVTFASEDSFEARYGRAYQDLISAKKKNRDFVMPSEHVLGFVRNFPRRPIRFGKIRWLAKNKKNSQFRRVVTQQGRLSPLDMLREGERLIGVHKLPDKLCLSTLNFYLCRELDHKMSESSYGYRLRTRGRPLKEVRAALRRFRNVITAAIKENRCLFFARIDITDFFGNVNHSRIIELLRSRTLPEKACLTVECYLEFIANEWAGRRIGVPQGCPISGVLTNLYLDDFDKLMESHGINIIRFSDDIVLWAESHAQLDVAMSLAERELNGIGLSLSTKPGKLQRAVVGKFESPVPTYGTGQHYEGSIDLLGFRFFADGSFEIRASTIKKARQKIATITSRDRGRKNKKTRSIIAKINCYFGWERRRWSGEVSCSQRSYRVGKKKRGFVFFCAALGYSRKIEGQLIDLDRYTKHRLAGWFNKQRLDNDYDFHSATGLFLTIYSKKTKIMEVVE